MSRRPAHQPDSRAKGPETLAELAAIGNAQVRACQAAVYIAEQEKAIKTALAIRDAAVLQLIEHHGVTRTAALVGLHISTVKAIRRAPRTAGDTA